MAVGQDDPLHTHIDGGTLLVPALTVKTIPAHVPDYRLSCMAQDCNRRRELIAAVLAF
jgi:hypothetical protein